MSKNRKATNVPLKTPINVPPIAPAHVLLGENCGANLGPPHARPLKYPAISVPHTIVNKKITAQNPNVSSPRKKHKATTGKDAYKKPKKTQIFFLIGPIANNAAKAIKIQKISEADTSETKKEPKTK